MENEVRLDNSKKHLIASHWLDYIRGRLTKRGLKKFLFASGNIPDMLSVVGTRICNFQCEHCFYSPENYRGDTKRVIQISKKLTDAGLFSKLLYAGRIILPEYIPLFKEVKNRNIQLGIIDNGSYTKYLNLFKKYDLRLDWLDISIDGTREIHNRQRGDKNAYDIAINGIERASEISKKLNILMTATKINYDNLHLAIKDLHNYDIDSFCISPVVANKHLKRKNLELNQMEFNSMLMFLEKKKNPITLNFYRANEFIMFLNSPLGVLNNCKKDLGYEYNKFFGRFYLHYEHKNLPIEVNYYPESLGIFEEVIIDANGAWILPYVVEYKISEIPIKYKIKVDLIKNDLKKNYSNVLKKYFDLMGDRFLDMEKKTLADRNI